MPVRTRKTVSENQRAMEKPFAAKCGTCGTEYKKWPRNKPAVHCQGSQVAFGGELVFERDVDKGHHATAIWPNCWRCGREMGCVVCVPGSLSDLICRVCIVKATREALLNGGPISNDTYSIAQRGGRPAPDLKDYPTGWANDYMGVSETWQLSGQTLYLGWKETAARYKTVAAMPQEATRGQRQRERNRQVAAMQEAK